MELSNETMTGAIGGIERIDAFFRRMEGANIKETTALVEMKERFTAAMNNDLGTPDATAVIFETINSGNAALDNDQISEASSSLATVTELLGVLGLGKTVADRDEEIESLLRKRENARIGGDFNTADEIRDLLKNRDIEIEDTPNGPIWRQL
tara:strand:+ start:82 stop:537 length:456 start_codon:yes stop_codon:yes gene_type:complete